MVKHGMDFAQDLKLGQVSLTLTLSTTDKLCADVCDVLFFVQYMFVLPYFLCLFNLTMCRSISYSSPRLLTGKLALGFSSGRKYTPQFCHVLLKLEVTFFPSHHASV